MKKTCKKLLSALMILVMILPVLMISASAQSIPDGRVGNYYQYEVVTGIDTGNMTDLSFSGDAVPGLYLDYDSNSIFFCGTPTVPGDYSFFVWYDCDGGGGGPNFQMRVAPAPSNCSGTITIQQGIKQAGFEVVDVGGMITYSELMSGSMPAGLTCDQYDSYFAVSGTPKETGTFSQKYHCYLEGDEECFATITVVVTAAPPTVAPTVTPKPEPQPELKVTKSPSGETVTVGGDALFISSAEGYSDVEWRIVPPSGSPVWRNKAEIEPAFPGVKVSTYKDNKDRECLTLSNIPLSMDGYYIQTKFWSKDKSSTAFTVEKACLLTVKEAALKQPAITTQPVSASKVLGEQVTLSVAATDPNGGSLSYQWYISENGSNAGGAKVDGATSSMFTVPQTAGTVYYYVAVTSNKGGKISTATASTCASVTFAVPVTPSASPSPTPSVSPSPTPSAEPLDGPGSSGRGNGMLWILILTLAVIAVAGALIFISVKGEKNTPKRIKYGKAAPAAEKGWICPGCGRRNLTGYCPECGTKKPRGEVQYVCDKCGWEPEDPTHPPRFCPECGDSFGDEDIVE